MKQFCFWADETMPCIEIETRISTVYGTVHRKTLVSWAFHVVEVCFFHQSMPRGFETSMRSVLHGGLFGVLMTKGRAYSFFTTRDGCCTRSSSDEALTTGKLVLATHVALWIGRLSVQSVSFDRLEWVLRPGCCSRFAIEQNPNSLDESHFAH